MSGSEGREQGYQANTNQARDEPIPASHEDEPGQEAVVRNQEHPAAAGEPVQPKPDGEHRA